MGVLAPKFEKAPVPRAKALAAAPGEASALAGDFISLKGFLEPCEELSPPKRLDEEEKLRPVEPVSFWPEPGVERESLLALRVLRVSRCDSAELWTRENLLGPTGPQIIHSEC